MTANRRRPSRGLGSQMGHATGYAANIALAAGVALGDFDVAALQRRLAENGALPGLDIKAVERPQAKSVTPV